MLLALLRNTDSFWLPRLLSETARQMMVMISRITPIVSEQKKVRRTCTFLNIAFLQTVADAADGFDI